MIVTIMESHTWHCKVDAVLCLSLIYIRIQIKFYLDLYNPSPPTPTPTPPLYPSLHVHLVSHTNDEPITTKLSDWDLRSMVRLCRKSRHFQSRNNSAYDEPMAMKLSDLQDRTAQTRGLLYWELRYSLIWTFSYFCWFCWTIAHLYLIRSSLSHVVSRVVIYAGWEQVIFSVILYSSQL